jgi:hypothetical protein
VSAADGRAVLLPTTAAERYQLSADKVEAAWNERTRGVLLASPSNPTGTSIAPDELRRILDVVRARGGLTLIDEIYLGLSHDDAVFGHAHGIHARKPAAAEGQAAIARRAAGGQAHGARDGIHQGVVAALLHLLGRDAVHAGRHFLVGDAGMAGRARRLGQLLANAFGLAGNLDFGQDGLCLRRQAEEGAGQGQRAQPK